MKARARTRPNCNYPLSVTQGFLTTARGLGAGSVPADELKYLCFGGKQKFYGFLR